MPQKKAIAWLLFCVILEKGKIPPTIVFLVTRILGIFALVLTVVINVQYAIFKFRCRS